MTETNVDMKLVEIIARRIATGGLNPLRNVPYSIDHVTNPVYRPLVIAYLREHYQIEIQE